jgi:ABC-type branched-subunit amino acid transport system substrate-binding protein
VVVGLLASYTGEQAADGFNIERAMLLAEHQINNATGVAGKRLCMVYGDTHSSTTRGLAEAKEMLEQHHPLVLIGPEDLDLARDIQPVIASHSTLNILPGITSNLVAQSSAGLLLKLGPPAESMGCSMGQSVYDNGFRSIAVVYSSSILSSTLAQSLGQRVQNYERPMSPAKVTFFPIVENLSSYGSLTRTVADTAPDAVVLLVSTTTAATFVQEWLPPPNVRATFMLGPGLLDQVLLENTPTGSLDGAYGVTATTSNNADSSALGKEYSATFGEDMFPVSNFYYDSLAVAALAIEAASVNAGGSVPDSEQVIAQLRYVTTSPGKKVTWNSLANGISLLRAGSDIDYDGVSGPLTMSASGEFDTASSVFDYNRAKGDTISFSNLDTCVAF